MSLRCIVEWRYSSIIGQYIVTCLSTGDAVYIVDWFYYNLTGRNYD
jgi:hypothetical protein